MYIADFYNYRIRKVTVSTGIITTIAGTGTSSYSGDNGPGTSASLYEPHGIALDVTGFFLHSIYYCLLTLLPPGNVYIADSKSNRIRKVTVSTGIITTVAGTGTESYSGDNGPATAATFYYPMGVALDSAGSFLSYYYL